MELRLCQCLWSHWLCIQSLMWYITCTVCLLFGIYNLSLPEAITWVNPILYQILSEVGSSAAMDGPDHFSFPFSSFLFKLSHYFMQSCSSVLLFPSFALLFSCFLCSLALFLSPCIYSSILLVHCTYLKPGVLGVPLSDYPLALLSFILWLSCSLIAFRIPWHANPYPNFVHYFSVFYPPLARVGHILTIPSHTVTIKHW